MFKFIQFLVILLNLLAYRFETHAQVNRKITIKYAMEGRSPITYGFWDGILNEKNKYKDEIVFKVRGKDDSLSGDISIEAKFKNDTIRPYYLNTLKVTDSMHITFCGSYRIRTYDLTEEEKLKKLITRRTGPNEFQPLKVQTDSLNRKYIEIFYDNDCITVPDELITSVEVVNRDFWVEDELAQKRRSSDYANSKDNGTWVKAMVMGVFGIVGIYTYLKLRQK